MIFYFSTPENLGLRDYLKIIRLIYKRNCPTLFEALRLNQNWSFTQVETSARLGVESEPLGEMFVYRVKLKVRTKSTAALV